MMRKLITAIAAVSLFLVPTAVARSDTLLDDYLDAPLSNVMAEGNGGVNPGFSTDPAFLNDLLNQARAQGVTPMRYKALLQQYWLAVASAKAGLDLDNWDPGRGLAANEQNLAKTFAYYQTLQREHPDFLWTGQGGMAGPSFAAGIMDVDLGRAVLGVREMRDVIVEIVGRLNEAAAPATAHLPEDVKAVLDVGSVITEQDIANFQVRVIGMSKHIYMDLIPQHEAFLGGGMEAIDEYNAAGLLDARAYRAWTDLATGEPDKVFEGNKDLLYREQYQAIGAQWDSARGYNHPVGRALTYLSTVAADPAIPGVIPPREASPLTLTAGSVTGEATADPQWHFQTPLPDFNWSVRDARWAYITEQMLPKYRHLKDHQPDVWMAALNTPMNEQIFEQRAFVRLPQMLRSMAATTQIQYY
ncbi:Tat pathway signal protein [Rhodococcus sp. NPDC058521]|uniref:Tat pathway signal protein n=1 Tax=Rhodococcus sp. NPDC058521 TaxID=3346536 RepID=UPI0036666BFC